jgi:hypothetical protein
VLYDSPKYAKNKRPGWQPLFLIKRGVWDVAIGIGLTCADFQCPLLSGDIEQSRLERRLRHKADVDLEYDFWQPCFNLI